MATIYCGVNVTRARTDLAFAGYGDRDIQDLTIGELCALAEALHSWRLTLDRRMGERLTSYARLQDCHMDVLHDAASSWEMPNAIPPERHCR